MDDIEDIYHPITLNENTFIDVNDGKISLLSFINGEDEKDFRIKRNLFIKGRITLKESIVARHKYKNAEDYMDVICDMKQASLYVLKLIGMFKSIKLTQLRRHISLFPDIINNSELNSSLGYLTKMNLIMPWEYQPVKSDNIQDRIVYTLTSYGFGLLRYGYDMQCFNPQNFLYMNPRSHIKFWEIVDMYQVLISLPIYKQSSTFFNDQGNFNISSPLQINVKLSRNHLANLVFYPVLNNDNENFYKKILAQWDNFVHKENSDAGDDDGDDELLLQKKVNDLPITNNILTFYIPTIERANYLTSELQLGDFTFPILFIIGEQIINEGIEKAFFEPNEESDGLDIYSYQNLLTENEDES